VSQSANATKPIQIEYADWVSDCIDDQTTDVLWVHGGLGCGKTFGAVQIHDNWILENLRCKASWFIEPTHGKVEDTAIPAWLEWFDLIEAREGRDFKLYRSKPQKLLIRTGKQKKDWHTIYFHSADRPNLMVGNKIGFFTLDEAGDAKFEVFERATTRRRDLNASYLQSLVVGAPQGLNWFADYANFVDYDSQKNERSFELWTEDNAHHLAPGYIESCLKVFGHNTSKVNSWLYGKFTSFHEGQAYPEYNDQKDRHSLDPDPNLPLHVCWDWNVQPLAWVATQNRYVDNDSLIKAICTMGESDGTSGLISEACVDFISRFNPRRGWKRTPIKIQGDATGKARSVRKAGTNFDEVERIFREFYDNVEVIAPSSNPGVEVRVETVNRAFSYGRFLIHVNDEQTSRSFLSTTWKENERKLSKPSDDRITHYSDAVGYDVFWQLHDEDLAKIPRRKIIY